MKTLLLSLFLPILTFAQTNIGGVLSSDTVLTLANSPYIVTNNLLVQQGVKVVVEPGVEFRFNQGIYLQVDGEFQAIGTPMDTILFTVNTLSGATGWPGIRFTDNATDYNPSTGNGCILDHCIIEWAENYLGMTASPIAVKISYCAVQVSSCLFRENSNQIRIIGTVPGRFLNNTFLRNGIALTGLVQGNKFLGVGPTLEGATFIENYVLDAGVSVTYNSIITNNTIENAEVGIILSEGDSSVISCNTFINDSIHLLIICEVHPTVINNNFLSLKPKGWNVVCKNSPPFYCNSPPGSGVYTTIDLSNNYWGGLTNGQMDSTIWDFDNDFSLAVVIDYSPTILDTVDFSSVNCSVTTSLNESAIQKTGAKPFPNPFSIQLSFSLTDNDPKTLLLYNFLGQKVWEEKFTNAIILSTEKLEHGIYFYELRRDSGLVNTGKVVKE